MAWPWQKERGSPQTPWKAFLHNAGRHDQSALSHSSFASSPKYLIFNISFTALSSWSVEGEPRPAGSEDLGQTRLNLPLGCVEQRHLSPAVGTLTLY